MASLTGRRGWVYGLCTVRSSGRGLLASAGRDGAIHIWNPRDGRIGAHDRRLSTKINLSARNFAWLYPPKLISTVRSSASCPACCGLDAAGLHPVASPLGEPTGLARVSWIS